MHKPITSGAEAPAITAVAIFSGLMELGASVVYHAWSDQDLGGGVELFALCAEYGRLSEDILTDFYNLGHPAPFNFPGVYDYDVSENLGDFLRAKILAGFGFEHDEVKHELGRLMTKFFSADEAFKANPVNAEIIKRHTGYEA